MKLPNGYGSVYKLKGKRRNPWVARKTIGTKLDLEKKKAYPVYQFIGYYPTREQALSALGAYNTNPYELEDKKSPTFREVYELWKEVAFEDMSDSQKYGYMSAAKSIEPIMYMPIKEIRLIHLQRAIDGAGKNLPSAGKIKTLYKKVFEHAVKNEFIPPAKAAIAKYVEVKGGNPDAKPHTIFTPQEIDFLWQHTDGYYAPLFLFLIYTGLRIDEAIKLQKENLFLPERYIDIPTAKTPAGARQVPIAEKIVPFVERFADTDSPYLIKGLRAQRISKPNLYTPLYQDLYTHGLNHTPHDARHTCASLLAEAEVDDRVIRSILGHSGHGVTERIYTHISIDKKIEAINLI